MRGAPQVGFSATIRKIKARTSLLTRFRPPTRRNLEIHAQYKRNPARCQFTTVRGVTKTRGFFHPDQNVLNASQNSLCRAVNRVRGRCVCKCEQLPTESQVFEDEVLAGTKRADDPPEEMLERHNHGKDIIGTIRIQFCAKPFILRMYDVLAKHTPRDREGRPCGWRLFQLQYSRNPRRCQAITVSGLTIIKADRHSRQSRESQTHRNLSEGVRRTLCARAER